MGNKTNKESHTTRLQGSTNLNVIRKHCPDSVVVTIQQSLKIVVRII